MISACDDDTAVPVPPLPTVESGVFIGNEGTFGFGNASLSYYDFENETLTNQVFENANNRPLGDVLQSIRIIDDKAFLVLNNSNKIEVMDVNTLEVIANIDSLTSPRYLLPINDDKAYVSDLFAHKINIIDINTYTKTGEITLPAWTEQMVIWEDKIFVALKTFWDKPLTRHLYIIDSNTDQVIDSLEVGANPSELIMDKDKKIWVMGYGRESTNDAASLYRINPENLTVEQTFEFSNYAAAFSPARLAMNAAKDSLYFSMNDIFVMPITASSLPTTPLLTADNGHFYMFGIHPNNGDIFVGDAFDFQQKGQVKIYNRQGILKEAFLAGVGPNGFYFY